VSKGGKRRRKHQKYGIVRTRIAMYINIFSI
jgi:hypothetical protein